MKIQPAILAHQRPRIVCRRNGIDDQRTPVESLPQGIGIGRRQRRVHEQALQALADAGAFEADMAFGQRLLQQRHQPQVGIGQALVTLIEKPDQRDLRRILTQAAQVLNDLALTAHAPPPSNNASRRSMTSSGGLWRKMP